MYRVVEVKPRSDYRVWIKFEDGVEGIVDLSNLAGKGIFTKWSDKKYFNSVYVDNESHTIAWPGGIDLCPDELYAEVTGENIDSLLKIKIHSEV